MWRAQRHFSSKARNYVIMDDINESFGRLSTSAQEWKPGKKQNDSKPSSWLHQSDLDPSTVKEFVPGRAWNSQDSVARIAHPHIEKEGTSHRAHGYLEHASEQHGQQASIPAGPSPPPPPSFRSLHSMGLSDELWRHYRQIALENHRQVSRSAVFQFLFGWTIISLSDTVLL